MTYRHLSETYNKLTFRSASIQSTVNTMALKFVFLFEIFPEIKAIVYKKHKYSVTI